MITLSACLFLLLIVGGCNAFQSPSAAVVSSIIKSNDDTTTALCSLLDRREYITSLLVTITTPAVLLTPQQTCAAAAELNFLGVYTDPKHPKGYRIIFGNGGERVTMKMQDDPNGEIYFLPIRVVDKEDANTVKKQFIFDFSPKTGGPANDSIVGTLEKDREGIPIITFPDGNTWKKRETGPIGVYKDESSNPKNLYSIRQVKGVDLTVDLYNNEKVAATFGAKAGNPAILFDFPGKAGVPGVFNMKKKTIAFEDGTIWTKF